MDQRQHGGTQPEILDDAGREIGGADASGAGELAIAAIADEVIVPRDAAALGIQPGFQIMPAAGAQEILGDVVLARPGQLHRPAGLLCDGRRFHHIIILQPPAETAAHPHHVDGDILRRHAQKFRHGSAARLRILRRRPDLDLVAIDPRGAVDRLHRHVRDEGVGIVGGHALGGLGHRRAHIAGRVDRQGGRLAFGIGRQLRPSGGGLEGGGAVAPLDLQRRAGALGVPGRVSKDGDTAGQAFIFLGAGHDEGVLHAAHRLDRGQIGRFHLGALHAGFVEGGVDHARHHGIDAVILLAGHDGAVVHAGLEAADQAEGLGVFHGHARRVRRGKGSGPSRELAIRRALRAVDHMALVCVQLCHRHAPCGGRCLQNHSARRCAHPAHRFILRRHRLRSASHLPAIDLGIGQCRHDLHGSPIGVQLFADHHRQAGADALAHFGIAGHDADATCGRYHHPGIQLTGFCRIGPLRRQAQIQAAAHRRAGKQEIAAAELDVHSGLTR